jgi:glyoxylate utilization-related uncharacterized protein
MTTFIDTKKCQRVKLAGLQGEVAEIVNHDLCGAENVVDKLRWMQEGELFNAEPLADTYQLIYLIEGDGVIHLDGKDYDVVNGAGIYLGPEETATIHQAGIVATKLLHLVFTKYD